ncbi:MAG: methyltransferase domain-containing protein, partial [Treponema sp.]|nr:methyltransferase domain-containing protein [Treponema sp.]
MNRPFVNRTAESARTTEPARTTESAPPAAGGAVLVAASAGRGRGGGHLNRSAALVRSLREAGAEAWLYPQDPGNVPGTGVDPGLVISADALGDREWALIVLDRFRCSPEELEGWKACGPVLGLDEGRSRRSCDFLVDLLPGLPGRERPNLASPLLLPLPDKRRPAFPGSGYRQILISFGAEDPGMATVGAALGLRGSFGDVSLTAVLGPLRRNNQEDRKLLEQAGVAVAEGVLGPSFRETLADYDLVITHFGVTAFEALYARVPVLLLNPGPYHEKLARHGGIPSAGAGNRGLKRLIPLVRESADLTGQSRAAAVRWGLEGDRGSLAALVLNARPRVHRTCPFCGSSRPRPVIGRFPGRTYRRCSCGGIYLDRLDPPPVEYGGDYFFSAYQKQYGRTYLEDFPALRRLGEKRLDRIAAVSGRTSAKDGASPRLLDIGCAYGPFLAAAKERGFTVRGLDPVPDAAAYAAETLHIPVTCGFFPETAPPGPFDVITLWYVIEHFEEPRR